MLKLLGAGGLFWGQKRRVIWKVNDLAFSTIGQWCDIFVLQSKTFYRLVRNWVWDTVTLDQPKAGLTLVTYHKWASDHY
jgi:hypothetical protein